jgi:hypothetical protein
MCDKDRLQGGLKPDRKGVHHKRTDSGKIFSPRKEDGKSLQGVTIEPIDRDQNAEADELVKGAA